MAVWKQIRRGQVVKKKPEPDASVFLTVDTYSRFHQFCKAFGIGKIPMLMVVGEPGTSKTQSISQNLKRKHRIIKGQQSAISIYCDLYRHRNELIVIDDVDSLYADDACRRIVKCLCQSDPIKHLEWNTRSRYLDEEQIPRAFDTMSNTCIIANEWKTISQDVAAIEDRGCCLRFVPTAVEVHKHVAPWFTDQQIFDFMAGIAHLIEKPSMRHYLFARNMKQSGFKDWRDLTIERVCSRKVMPVAKIVYDPALPTEEDKAAAFVSAGLGHRTTFFRLKKKLPKQIEIPRFRVKGKDVKPPRPSRKRVAKSQPSETDTQAQALNLRVIGDE
jgi:hypothetical protein